jgi:hypothetical protein
MAKAMKVLCDRCEQKIVPGVSFCGRCGYPTKWASHEERTQWEVSQWKGADREQKQQSSRSQDALRRWGFRPFARRVAPEPEWHLSLVKAPSGPPVSSPPPPAAPPAPPRVQEPEPARPAPKATPKVAPGPRDAEPIGDEPSTVLAMRMLNERVKQLDERIRQLERELAREGKEHSLTS